jgi:nicotinate-nucleotide pyrophosphorylase
MFCIKIIQSVKNQLLWRRKMFEAMMRLNLDEMEALKTALQLLSKKEQKLMESSGKVSLSALYNKLQSSIEVIQIRTLDEVAQ